MCQWISEKHFVGDPLVTMTARMEAKGVGQKLELVNYLCEATRGSMQL